MRFRICIETRVNSMDIITVQRHMRKLNVFGLGPHHWEPQVMVFNHTAGTTEAHDCSQVRMLPTPFYSVSSAKEAIDGVFAAKKRKDGEAIKSTRYEEYP